MKIVFVHNILWSKYRIHLFNALARRLEENHDFKVIQVALTEKSRAALPADNSVFCKHRYCVLYNGSYEDFSPVRRALSVLNSLWLEQPDVVVATGFSSAESWAAWIFCIVFRRNLMLTVDSSIYDQRSGLFKLVAKRIFLSASDAVLAYGTSSKKYIVSLGYSTKKIFTPFHSVDQSYYKPLSTIKQTRTSSSSHFTFLFVGRLAPEKNIDLLIDGFCRAFNQNVNDVSLHIIGDGPLRLNLETKLHQLNDRRIRLLGSYSGELLCKHYLAANCLVLPSTYEPWGLVANESLCLGTPVIVSDRCGCKDDLVPEGSSSFVFKSNSIEHLVMTLRSAKNILQLSSEEVVAECHSRGSRFSLDRACASFNMALLALN